MDAHVCSYSLVHSTEKNRTSQKRVQQLVVRGPILLLAILATIETGFGQTAPAPSALSFGNQVVGQASSPQAVTLKNSQEVPLVISSISIRGGNGAADFVAGGDCPTSPATLGAGETCRITVTFTPSAPGERTASLAIKEDAPASPDPVSLKGIGMTQLDFAAVSGKMAEGIFSFANPTPPATSASQASTPAAEIPSNKAGRGRPVSIGPGSGLAPLLQSGTPLSLFTATPAALAFPSLTVGTLSNQQTVTVSNRDRSAHSLSLAVATGDFAIAFSNCGSLLGAGRSCSVSLTFKPMQVGVRSGTLTLPVSGASSSIVVPLSGIGNVNGLASVVVSPSNSNLSIGGTQQFTATGWFAGRGSADLTASVLWFSSAPSVVTVSNSGLATALTFGSATITATLAVASSLSGGVGAPTVPSIVVPVTGSTSVNITPGFISTATLQTARTGDTATLLDNGMVLFVGGSNSTGVLGSAELFNPATGTFSYTGSLKTARTDHTATLLGNGMVLIAGGFTSLSPFTPTTSAELYNPSTGTFTATGSLNASRVYHTATILPNGNVLIAGGATLNGLNLTAVNTAEVYNFLFGTFSYTGNLQTARYGDTATLLNSGKVLIVGGYSTGIGILGSAELYNPTAGTFSTTTGGLNTQRYDHTATLLNDGTVLIAGGISSVYPYYLSSGEIYNPTSESFTTTTGSLSTPRYFDTATLLNDGNVLFTGGQNGNTGQDLTSAEIYDPSSQSFTLTGSLGVDPIFQTATLLPNGEVLVAGGTGVNGVLAAAELYETNVLTPPDLVSITVTPSNPTIPLGSSQVFTATGTFSSGPPENLASVTWASTNPVTVSINSNGVAYAQSLISSATIIACAGTVCGTTTAMVGPPALAYIVVTPANPTLAVAGTQQFTATGYNTDGSSSNLTGSVIWNSSAPGVASVNSAGLATGVSFGSTTISATMGAVAGLTTLNVSGPTLVSIAVTPSNPSIAVGSTQQFTATGTYSDASMQTLTGAVTWSSSQTATATISNASGTQGLALGVSVGTTTIQAAAGSINGSTTLTVGGTFALTGNMAVTRYRATATLLNNGMVLIAGGYNGTVLAEAELYNPATGTFTATGPLSTARYFHTATLLDNGMVLVVGGVNTNVIATAELYDPASGTFNTTGSLNTGRYGATATLLPNGMVLVAGGEGSSGYLASAELYNPATGTFTLTGNLNAARALHTATLLNNGTVLVAGGSTTTVLASAEIYDPASGTFSFTGNLNAARRLHTATLLNGGMVLMAGGSGSTVLASAELFNPGTGTFTTTGSLNTARDAFTSTLLNNGMVLVAGGTNGTSSIGSAELYDPNAATFSFTGSLNNVRGLQTATLLPSGTVLIAAGYNVSTGLYLSSAELYEPVTLTPANLVSITLSPTTPTIPLFTGLSFTATGTFTGGSMEQLVSVTWSSSNPAVVSVSNDSTDAGEAYGVAAGGPATIQACAGSVCDSTTVNVSVATLVSISVTPTNPTITYGNTQQFSAIGNYSNGATQNLTSVATWGSSNTGVATISNAMGTQGLAASAGTGTTTIQATAGALFASTSLSVTAGFAVAAGSLNTGRYWHTATLLNNGIVLIAGGISSSTGAATASAELYSPTTEIFTVTGSLNTARYEQTATLLDNGMVLIVGGINSAGDVSASAELYNPATGTFTVTGSLNIPRYGHTATLLPNGMVLVAGGTIDTNFDNTNTAELYNPSTGAFTYTGNMNVVHNKHTAALLTNGIVLIAGGITASGGPTAVAELYNPATGTFTTTGSLNYARYDFTATLLNNGIVLVAAGISSTTSPLNPVAAAELYNPATGTFTTTGSLNTPRWFGTTTLLNNGTALIAGGELPGAAASAELYNPTTGDFTVTTSLNSARYLQTATLLPKGTVLVAGGTGTSGAHATAELYEPSIFTPPNLVSIALTPSNPTIPLDTAQQFVATGTFSDNSVEQLASVTWSSSDPSAISITDDATNLGSAYALQASGSATISACAGSICGSTMASVGPPALVSIAVTPANPSIAVAGSQQFTATGTYSDGSNQNLTTSVIWNSSAPGVASINSAGLATAVSFGSTTISATMGAVAGLTTLNVSGPTLVSIAVTPSNPSIAVGSTQQFTATGTYSDASMQTLTGAVTWSSSQTATATISNASGTQGLATGVYPGTSTIQAAAGAINGSTLLTVTAGFVPTGNMVNSRFYTTATVLTNGQTLVAGGRNTGGTLASAELYSPNTGTFAATGSLTTPRNGHTATILGNGQVLVAGGGGSTNSPLNSAELYTLGTAQFTSTGTMNAARRFHTATLLQNGLVLLAGGATTGGTLTSSAELYNPGTGTFTATGSLNTARSWHTATLLNNGMVLITGGCSDAGCGSSLASAELYNPSTGTFTTTGSMNAARAFQGAVLLNTGYVLVAGGYSTTADLTSAELYNPNTGTFAFTGSLSTARDSFAMVLLTNGTVLVGGGENYDGVSLAVADVYDPTAATFSLTGSLTAATDSAGVALLNSGQVLIAGGYGNAGGVTTSQLYDPASLTPPNLVSIAIAPSNVTLGVGGTQQFTATGTFSDNSQQQLGSLYWYPDNQNVLHVTSDVSDMGSVDGFGTGSANLYACAGPICGSNAVNVVSGSPTASLNVDLLAFASQILGNTSPSMSATLTNTGNATLDISNISVKGSDPNDFDITGNTCGSTLGFTAGSNSCTVTLVFNPQATGARTALLYFTDDSSYVPGSLQDVTLSSEGLAPLAITTTSIPSATAGTPYSLTFQATGGTGAYSWTYSLSMGQSFPACLVLTASPGTLTGLPTTACAGNYTFNLTLKDSLNNQLTQTFSMSVNSYPPALCESGNESILTGQYAFSIIGYRGAGFLGRIGSFTADGMGNITGGEFDRNGPGFVGANTVSILASTYSVGFDNRGCATFLVSGGGQFITRFVLGSISSGTAQQGRMIEYDAVSSSELVGTGQLLQQSTSTTASASNFGTLSGGYVHLLTGWDSQGGNGGGRFICAGVRTATPTSGGAGTYSNGEEYCNDQGFAPSSPTTGLTGSYAGVDAYGRFTETVGSTDLVGYLNSGTATGAFELTSSINGNDLAVLAGQSYQQSGGPYNAGSISGDAIYYTDGIVNSTSGQIEFGLANSDGVSTLSINQDYKNQAGTWVNNGTSESCPYTVAANGRLTYCAGIMYLYAPSTTVVANNDSGGSAGSVVPQTVPNGGFTSLSGAFFGSTFEVVNQQAQSEDAYVTLTTGAGGAVTGTDIGDENSPAGQEADGVQTISNTTLATSGTISTIKNSTPQVSGVMFDTSHFLISSHTNCSGSPTCYPTFDVLGPTVASPVTLSITSPVTSSVNVTAGQALPISVLISGTANTNVTWAINGISGLNNVATAYGSITGNYASGFTFTAPSRLPDVSTYNIVVYSNADASQSAYVNVTIQPAAGPPSALTITTTSVPSGTLDTLYDVPLLTNGGTLPVSWTVSSGALPAGIRLVNAPNGVGILTGAHTVSSGVFNFTLEATDSTLPTANTAMQAYTLVMNTQPVTFTLTALPNGQVGIPYGTDVTANGGTKPYTYSITSGSLPTWATLNTSTGLISGTPTVAGVGTSNFTITITDSTTPTHVTASEALSITINNGAALPCADSGSEALLSGQYAFSLTGFTSTGYQAVVGSITLDGSGHILAGEVDTNGVNGVTSSTVLGPSSSYSVGSNNLGCATIVAGSNTFNLRFSIGTFVSNVATAGRLVEWDNPYNSSTYFAATGAIKQQTSANFSADLSGSYVVSSSGWDTSTSKAVAFAGVANAGSGAFTNLEFDENDGGTVTNTTGLGGTYSTFDSNGRGTTSFTSGATTVSTGVAYMVSTGDLFYLQTSSPYVEGEFQQQTVPNGGFVAGSFSGPLAFYYSELNSSPDGEAAIGLISADGSSSANVTEYDDYAGTTSTYTPTCSYSVATNGRITFTSGGTCGSHPPLFYLISANTGVQLFGDNGVGFGRVFPQVGGPFSSASLNGSYFEGDGQVTSFNIISTANGENIGVGAFSVNGMGGYGGYIDYTGLNGQTEDSFNVGSIGSINSNGTFGSPTVTNIIVSGTLVIAIDNSGSPIPIIQLLFQ